ncbi:phosphatidate cytidylyltransferase [Reinekea blandensis]|uniref:Phosphatidate cytidylyltransferase n=1 Tax=Reinekea blandensis MED297 TaxID=314283 RepID=A4BCG1_9GAMM|nr:phosphatidate cytidylyltransferase [Reinekea blandensis]EAR10227.1 phosphatidate cytidylyltransferase [Reinekea sp. MED297] [Reinekea blandensis MED297]
MLLQRIITALVLAPLMLAGIYLLPDLYFRGFIGIIVLLGVWEWANMSGLTGSAQKLAILALTAVLLLIPHLFIPVADTLWIVAVLAALLWWLVAIVVVFRFPDGAAWLGSRSLRLLVAIPVLGGFWMGLVWLKNQPDSLLLLTWLMLLVWGADIGAYFAGRLLGRRKLAPKVSPGKTWAGVYGGMLTSILVSVVIAHFYLQDHSVRGWTWLLLLSAAIVALSVIGDLFESLMKRNRGIKDSSALLPGHGGVLDRIDSLCAATPLFVLLWFVLSVV